MIILRVKLEGEELWIVLNTYKKQLFMKQLQKKIIYETITNGKTCETKNNAKKL